MLSRILGMKDYHELKQVLKFDKKEEEEQEKEEAAAKSSLAKNKRARVSERRKKNKCQNKAISRESCARL